MYVLTRCVQIYLHIPIYEHTHIPSHTVSSNSSNSTSGNIAVSKLPLTTAISRCTDAELMLAMYTY